MDSLPVDRKIFRFGAYELDVSDGVLRKGGVRLRVQPQPLKVLLALLERRGELVTREELREKLWPTETYVDFEQGLNAAVTRLRQTLVDSAENPRFVQTEARLGYRMIVPVQETGTTLQASGPPGEANGLNEGAAVATVPKPPRSRRRTTLWIVAGIVAAVAGGAIYARVYRESRAKTAAAELAYERGIALLRERSLAKVKQGADELRHAVEDNPDLAKAWAGLAESAILLDPVHADIAIGYARRAVGVDAGCGECQGILGSLLFFNKRELEAAGVHLRKASELRPDDPKIQISLAEREAALGRIPQALEILDRAEKRFRAGLHIGGVRAMILYYGRDYEGAIRESDRLTAINLTAGLEWKSNALFQLGRHAEAVAALHGFLGSWSSASPETIANRKNAAVTRFEEAGLAAVLGDLLRLTDGPVASTIHSHNRARWLMLLGRHDGAIRELQVAVKNEISDVVYLKVDPVFNPIRARPEFQQILKTAGLDE